MPLGQAVILFTLDMRMHIHKQTIRYECTCIASELGCDLLTGSIYKHRE